MGATPSEGGASTSFRLAPDEGGASVGIAQGNCVGAVARASMTRPSSDERSTHARPTPGATRARCDAQRLASSQAHYDIFLDTGCSLVVARRTNVPFERIGD